ncbi:prenyltransferase/squalene oxidase repeat-containing protein [Flavihumibacter petaseus]|uniref:Squalene cyclase C-terminal domain-containing protein n=1 Tax=Flavihumibacter petaseus NBRC 106054 TaxID=1220578 RepID=A0A0E9N6J2_9BACT|nr:prenyltransferase/squalene oxidase repeat-containing protein [Flavihumibacter petaseus]GAO45408.1 hypothetical protein FPE01S_05_01030 [Flavihumibacter petaseus NBRC 106054]
MPVGKDIIRKGLHYILAQKGADELWSDFETLAGPATEWVSAYTLSGLAAISEYQVSINESHKRLLSCQRKSGGWGYNHYVPPDADSTAWVLLCYATLPCWRPSALSKGLRYLLRHADQETGGFSTYISADQIDRYIGARPEQVEGWLQPHPCVTGVALQAILYYGHMEEADVLAKGCDYLLRGRGEDRLWESYWWKGRGYATYHALKALLLMHRLGGQKLRQTLEAIADHQDKEGFWRDNCGHPDAFNTAFYCRSLALTTDSRYAGTILKGTKWLAAVQMRDGSWPSTPMLRIPVPMITEPEAITEWRENELGTGVILADQHRLFTSMSILQALHYC